MLRQLFRRDPPRFLSDAAFQSNLQRQLSMTPQTLEHLRARGAPPSAERKVEYFFYTNARAKALALGAALTALGYTLDVRPTPKQRGLYTITGWTTSIVLAEPELVAWTEQMCHLGLKHDCDFDGWGTYAE